MKFANVRPSPTRLKPAGFIEPCIATGATRVPEGAQWVHEIKHDGYRMIACRRGDRVRLCTRRGFDWTERYPLIVRAILALSVNSITIDGEAVCCGERGVADFEKLQGREFDGAVFLQAFDLLELNGEDVRQKPLENRKAILQGLVEGGGLEFVEHYFGSGSLMFD